MDEFGDMQGGDNSLLGGAAGAGGNLGRNGKRYANTAGNARVRSMQNRGGLATQKMSTSPFRKLNDEEVFITRETEKQKRKEAKERAKNLKIWDKKTSTSRMPLRRVKDSDVPPAQMEDNIYNFNSEQRGYISTAMHIAKSRVQFSREQQMRPQNIKEFVDQKKEMFLVELSFNTVKKEIEELDNKQLRKKLAIENSKKQLDSDNAKLIEFIKDDQIQTSKIEKEAKEQSRLCQQKQEINKDLDNKINNLKSEISKNKDILGSLEEHKKFIIELSKIQNAQWVVEREAEKKRKRDMVKKRWIEEHKRDARDDNIIFREDEDLFSMENYVKGGGASSIADASEKASSLPAGGSVGLVKNRKQAANAIQFQQLKRENMTEKDWEAKFELLFAEDLIPLDEKFFDEELCFKDPNDLNQIFSELEEQNLYLIHQSQDLEDALESMKNQETKMKDRLGKEVETHKKNKEEINEQIVESQNSLADLKKKSVGITIQSSSQHQSKAGSGAHSSAGDKEKLAAAAEMEVNIEDLLNELRNNIERVYKECKNSEIDLQAKQTIDILTEIEVEIEEKMKEISYFEMIDESEVTKQEKDCKAEYKKEQRKIKADQEAEANEKKNQELKSRMDRVYQKVGRQAMPRSQKKRVKREVRVVKIDQETLDRQRYLGEEIPEMMMAGGASAMAGSAGATAGK